MEKENLEDSGEGWREMNRRVTDVVKAAVVPQLYDVSTLSRWCEDKTILHQQRRLIRPCKESRYHYIRRASATRRRAWKDGLRRPRSIMRLG